MIKSHQLQLVSTKTAPFNRSAWELSPETKEIGRVGLLEARRALGSNRLLQTAATQTTAAQTAAPIAA